MALEPRFRRVAALHRRFVNREDQRAIFDEELGKIGHGPRVLNVTGVGGIGKSRLLREFEQRAQDTCMVATLDLQVPAHRQQEDALAVLRMQLGRQGVRFDRYDIAYAVLWQRLHPHLGLTRRELPFVESSEVLTEVLDTAAGVPVFATAVGLVKLLDRGADARKRRRHLRTDETLGQLDQLPGADLVDAVTYLFAEDLRVGRKGRPYLVVIDAYDALGQAASDVWLRDLVAQLDRGLVVVASREPLLWQQYASDWGDIIRELPLEGLPMEARMELLTDGGVTDPHMREVIAQASIGVPFYLHLAVDSESKRQVVSQDEIMQRFLQHVDPDERRYLELLGIARTFDFELFNRLAQAFHLPAGQIAWERLTSYSFVYPAPEDRYQLHQLMASVLRVRLSPTVTRETHRVLHDLWSERAHGSDAPTALREAAYHGLGAGVLSSDRLLDYADQIAALGGSQGVSGLVSDLKEFLDQGEPDDVLDQTARCLTANRQEQQVGGLVLIRTALLQLSRVRALLDNAEFSESISCQLLSVAGELCVCAGWLAYDSDDQQLARRLYGEAHLYATHSDDPVLQVHVASNSALQAVRLAREEPGRAREALRFVAAAEASAWRCATPRVHALLALREAYAHSMLKDELAYRSAITKAWRELDRGPHEDDPPWVRFVDAAELTGNEGMAAINLGQARRAVQRFAEVVVEPRLGQHNRTYYRAGWPWRTWPAATRPPRSLRRRSHCPRASARVASFVS
ncbi:AAA family ATPase [Microtetraspora sp. NBRC 16547]|uniref:AAA family ATPase n=1 Tax=Microtetraspora sp. NBRC 16547 TaxID=3030993 RepID=UPI0024A50A86|nr:AAA family ATPase [Microtetraspora sp. NBRC 16547]GLW98884.1 hypothetical protein Misp02_29710 [Microtetraspora sp. NBRC 16547]